MASFSSSLSSRLIHPVDLCDFPTELLQMILTDSSMSGRLSLRLVSKRWKEMIRRVRVPHMAMGSAASFIKMTKLFTLFPKVGTLTLDMCSQLRAVDIDSVLRPLESVESLSLPKGFDESHLSALVNMPFVSRLKSLVLPRLQRFMDRTMPPPLPGATLLTHFAALESLTIRGFDLSAAIGYVAQLQCLKKLLLADASMSGYGKLDPLSALQQLRRLEVSPVASADLPPHSLRLDRSDFSAIASLRNLETLAVGKTDCLAEDFRLLSSLPNLTELEVPLSVCTQENAISCLTGFTALRNISQPYGVSLSLSALKTLSSHLGQLRSLTRPWDQPASDELFDVIGKFTNLRSVSLDRDSSYRDETQLEREGVISDKGIESLSGLRFLTALTIIHRPKVTDKSVAIISESLTNLRSLNLKGCTSISNDAFVHLRKLTNLLSLELGRTKVNDSSLNVILQLCTRIQGLNLTGTEIFGCEFVTNLQGLSGLYLNECKNIDDDGIRFLTVLTSLVNLSISRTAVTGVGLAGARFARALRCLSLFHRTQKESSVGIHKKVPLESVTTLPLSPAGVQVLSQFQNVTSFSAEVPVSSRLIRPLFESIRFTNARVILPGVDWVPVLLCCTTLGQISLISPKETDRLSEWRKLVQLPRLKQLEVLFRDLDEHRKASDSEQPYDPFVRSFADTDIKVVSRRTFLFS